MNPPNGLRLKNTVDKKVSQAEAAEMSSRILFLTWIRVWVNFQLRQPPPPPPRPPLG
jgi:hypothetical protein